MGETKITWEQVKELIPERISLIYVDYRESLEDNEELIQEVIHNENWDALNEKVDEWYRDHRWDNETEYTQQLRHSLQSTYDLEMDEADEIIEEFEDEIRDIFCERDDSDPIKDLIRNTGRLIAHYDTGYYMESESWNWSMARVRLERYTIKKHLGIVATTAYDDSMDMMIMQASYGGQLLIYFNLDIDDFIGDFKERKTIKFKNAMFGIVDHNNGSGDVMDRAISEEISLPYNRENIFLEKSIKYNWTYSIAGMCNDWADSTEISFSEEESGEIETSSTNELLKKEEQYNKTFKEGKCTFGDMDIRRHRKAYYINDFPCGNKCQDCGTFWID